MSKKVKKIERKMSQVKTKADKASSDRLNW